MGALAIACRELEQCNQRAVSEPFGRSMLRSGRVVGNWEADF